MTSRATATATAAIFLAALLGPALARAQEGGAGPATPPVEAARQVTANPTAVRAHATPDLAVNPQDPQVLAIGEAEAYTGKCFVDVSTDGGLSWVSRPVPLPPEWASCVYANFGPIVDVAFAPDGALLYAFSGHNPTTYQSRMHLARSADLGRTWQVTALPRVGPDLEKGQFGADALPSLAIDPSNPRRVAVGWMTNNGTWNVSDEVRRGKRYFYDVFSRPFVAVSADGGTTFGAPVDAAAGYPADPAVRGWMNEPHLVFGTEGELYAFFGENMRPLPEGSEASSPPAHLFAAVSRDGGKAFTMAAVHTRPQKKRDWLGQPSPAVDPSTSHVYVVWDDQTEGPSRVAFSRSTDRGKTWGNPEKLNDVDAPREWNFCEFCPAMSVAPNGRIDVAWYDWRNDAAFDPEAKTNAFQDVYYNYSTDGGRTWSPDVRITDRSIDRRLGVFDTMGLHGSVAVASTDAAALFAWDDTRNSTKETQSQDVYFTRARQAPGAAAPAAVAAPSALWAVIGAGAALAAGGVILLLVGAGSRRRPQVA